MYIYDVRSGLGGKEKEILYMLGQRKRKPRLPYWFEEKRSANLLNLRQRDDDLQSSVQLV